MTAFLLPSLLLVRIGDDWRDERKREEREGGREGERERRERERESKEGERMEEGKGFNTTTVATISFY